MPLSESEDRRPEPRRSTGEREDQTGHQADQRPRRPGGRARGAGVALWRRVTRGMAIPKTCHKHGGGWRRAAGSHRNQGGHRRAGTAFSPDDQAASRALLTKPAVRDRGQRSSTPTKPPSYRPAGARLGRTRRGAAGPEAHGRGTPSGLGAGFGPVDAAPPPTLGHLYGRRGRAPRGQQGQTHHPGRRAGVREGHRRRFPQDRP